MATTQTAGVGRIQASSRWRNLIVGIVIGVITTGFVAWMMTQDSRDVTAVAQQQSIDGYSLRKLMEAEKLGGADAAAVPSAKTVVPSLPGASSLAKVEQFRTSGVVSVAAAKTVVPSLPSASSLAKVEQFRTSGVVSVAAAKTVVPSLPSASSLAKVEQFRTSGVEAAQATDVGSNAYSLYKIEQVHGTPEVKAAVSSEPHVRGLVE